jgi:hypothetical protein
MSEDVQRTPAGGRIMKTTAKIPMQLWKEVKKACVDQDMDLADAINAGLEIWIAQQPRPKAK